MNIQSIPNNNITMGAKPSKPDNVLRRIKQKVLDTAPSATFNDENIKLWLKADEKMSKPAENRGVMGATAIVLQPLIDASNKKVDSDTRQISIYRTTAKIIAGTGVGILVRGSAYSIVGKMTDFDGSNKYSKALLPSKKKYFNKLKAEPKLLKNYKSALSTGIAIAAMCITNFVIDAPLTTFLTNKFTDIGLKKKASKLANKEAMDKEAQNV